jgi:hypothetical protein
VVRLSRLAAPFLFTLVYSNKNIPNLAKTDCGKLA